VSAYDFAAIARSGLPWLVYFLPLLVALILRKRRWVVIGFVNLVFGLTVIGWIIALVLAFTLRKSRPKVWDGAHNVKVGPGGGTLPVWVARCPCGWVTTSWSKQDIDYAASQVPHPPPQQAYYGGPS
jgi:hypothetical protein